MKIDLKQKMTNPDDSPNMEPKGKDGTLEQTTLGDALKRALLLDLDGEGNPIKGAKKLEHFALFLKIKKAGQMVDLTPEELTHLREIVLNFPSYHAGSIRALLG